MIQTKNETDEKLMRTLRKQNISYNPVMSGMAFTDDMTMVWGGTGDPYENPDTFQESCNHHDEADTEQSRTAIRKEFNNMI